MNTGLGVPKGTFSRRLWLCPDLNAIWLARDKGLKSLTFKNETLVMKEWAVRLNSSTQTLDFRLKMGWCVPCTVTLPTSDKTGCPHRPKPKFTATEKLCPDCGQTKPLKQFSPHKNYLSRRNTYCKPCNSQRTIKSNKRHSERVRKYGAAYRLNNPDKVRESGKRARQQRDCPDLKKVRNWLQRVSPPLARFLSDFKLSVQKRLAVGIAAHVRACKSVGCKPSKSAIVEILQDAKRGIFLFEDRERVPISERNYAHVYEER